MAKTDEQVMRDRDDAEMIKRPHLWPHMFLPMKRYREEDDDLIRHGMETAVAAPPLDDGRVLLKVHGNIWGDIEKTEVVTYESAERVVDDGWMVD